MGKLSIKMSVSPSSCGGSLGNVLRVVFCSSALEIQMVVLRQKSYQILISEIKHPCLSLRRNKMKQKNKNKKMKTKHT